IMNVVRFRNSAAHKAAIRQELSSKQGMMEAVLLPYVRYSLRRAYSAGVIAFAFLVAVAPRVFAQAPIPKAERDATLTVAQPKDPPSADGQSKTAPPKANQSDPVLATIAAAERAYESGQANYKSGHLDAAKQDFNRAVDILMQGPVSIKDDERL